MVQTLNFLIHDTETKKAAEITHHEKKSSFDEIFQKKE